MWQGKQDFQRSRAALSNLSVEQNPRQASERKGRKKKKKHLQQITKQNPDSKVSEGG